MRQSERRDNAYTCQNQKTVTAYFAGEQLLSLASYGRVVDVGSMDNNSIVATLYNDSQYLHSDSMERVGLISLIISK